MTTTRDAERSARRSDVLAWAVRAGLVGYGLLHFLVAWVAVRVVSAPDRGSVTGRGALAQLADESTGRLTLVVLAVGFGALVVWQLIAAAVGFRHSDTPKRHLERFAAVCRAATYAYLTVVTAQLALAGGGSGGGSPRGATATVMSWPAGVWLVAAVGVVLVGVGVGLTVFGWRRGFVDQVDRRARSREHRRVPIVMLGLVGYVTKGLALVVIGVLLGWAAWTHDPSKSGGLDRALHELVGGAPGKVAIIGIAAGLLCFGLFLLARAWHLNRDSLTS